MPQYSYRGQSSEGEYRTGIVQAASSDIAAEILEQQDISVISLVTHRRSLKNRIESMLNRVSIKDLVIFSRQLSFVVSAGIPLVQGMRILVQQTENPRLQQAIGEVSGDVEGGAKLSAALERHDDIFSSFYISIIKSGETSGKLEDVLQYLADQLEKDYDMASKIRGAMIYPAFILVGLFVVGALMMVLVVPQLTSILTETGAELPFSTRALIAVSSFLVSYWWVLLLLAVLFGGYVIYSLRTDNGKRFWDGVLLRLPIFGSLQKKIIIVRLSRSLHTLIVGGVPLSQSLQIVAEVAGNQLYYELLMETYREVESGNSISTIFNQSDLIPPMVTQMMSLGERTGRLEDILEKLGSFYTREVDNMVANLVSLLEPLLMLVMGIAVGLLVSAVILPVYNLANSF